MRSTRVKLLMAVTAGATLFEGCVGAQVIDTIIAAFRIVDIWV